MSSVAVCIPTRQDRNGGSLAFPLVCLALQDHSDFAVYIRDEGERDAYADPCFRLVMNLLAMKGIRVDYWRTLERRGAGFARRALYQSLRDERYVLWLDDDMILEPNVLSRLRAVLESGPEIGFVQACKCELDPRRKYHNDINVLNGPQTGSDPIPIWFGDTACLLVRRDALSCVDWELLTRYQLDGLTGEDVSMSLMMAEHFRGLGVPGARGWHLSPAVERWLWEPPSDVLQVELLRGKVSPEILQRALPHLAAFIHNSEDAATDGGKHPQAIQAPESSTEDTTGEGPGQQRE